MVHTARDAPSPVAWQDKLWELPTQQTAWLQLVHTGRPRTSLKLPRLDKNCGVASSTANTLSSMAFSYHLAAEDVKQDVRFLAQLTLGRLLTLRKVPHLGVVVKPPHSGLRFCVAYVMS